MPLENEDRFDGPVAHKNVWQGASTSGIKLPEVTAYPEQRKLLIAPEYLFAPLLGAPGGYIIEKRNASVEKLQVEGMLSVYGDRLPKQGLVYLVNSALKVVKTFKYEPIQTWQIQEDSSIKGNFLL